MIKNFLFATGLESAQAKEKDGKRNDLLQMTRHYQMWRRDLELCLETSIKYLRYGLPYYKMHLGPNRYDWSFCDEVFPVMQQLGIEPIVDLCHFGVPDWISGFNDKKWPEEFAQFAKAFAQRYAWVKYYTPINEVLYTAKMSGGLGWWHQAEKSDQGFVDALVVMLRAYHLSAQAILQVQPEAVFFPAEPVEMWHPGNKKILPKVNFDNRLRFISLDLMFGHELDSAMAWYLTDHKVSSDECRWLLDQGRKLAPYQIMGLDYYAGNERRVHTATKEDFIEPILGFHGLARLYYRRYGRMIMLTETNNQGLGPERAADWLWRMWRSCELLREENIPLLGFCWYGLIDPFDLGRNKMPNYVGLYDIDRNPHPVAAAFRDLINAERDLPLLPRGLTNMQF